MAKVISSLSGSTGLTGAKGDKGDIGLTGVAGTNGLDGAKGDKGDQGSQGFKGDIGLTGADGAMGVQGPQGIQGIQGETGLRGIQGETGPQGPIGFTGEKGADGTGVSIKGSFDNTSQLPASGADGDAYLISGNLHVWNGTAWVNVGNIQGPQGLIGLTGATGNTGPQGIKGEKGDQGIQGIQGLKGNTGAKGDTGSFNGDITADQVTETATRKFQTPTQSAYNDATSSIQQQIDSKQSTLVSGTTVKTIEGQNILGSGNIDLVKADVGLSNVDNTSDSNKPISTATQTALDLKANNSDVVKLTGNQTISGQKSFSLTGKIDMQTNDTFPAIMATAIGINGRSAAEFINRSSFPNSNALRLQTSPSGGVGNRALDVSNQSSIGTGIFSIASSGGVSISSQSGNGDSYISNITYGGTGRNYVGRNDGIETYSVDKTGNVIGNSYIKRSTPANNILLAGGGDLAQGTAFNKNFGTTVGTVVEGGTLGSNAYNSTAYLPLTATAANSTLWGGLDANFTGGGSALSLMIGRESISGTATSYTSSAVKSWLGLGTNAYSSTAYLPLGGGILSGDITVSGGGNGLVFNNPIGASSGITHKSDSVGVWNINKGAGDSSENYNIYNFTRGKIDFSISNSNGGITASPATLDTQLATLGQVKGTRPYKVYTALFSQNSTSNPTVVILENTLGTVTFTRSSNGVYIVNSSGLFTADKTFVIMGAGVNANVTNAITLMDSSTFYIVTKESSTQSSTDSANTKVAFEIRVYN